MAEVVFVQPFEVGEELAQKLQGRVVVLDVAFCADTPRSSFATTTLPFIQALGERLVLWVDHHEHERHTDFFSDSRFVLSSREQHPAVPEMITPDMVQSAGQVDTIVAHGDFDGIMAAAKWLLGGEEPYPGADEDARAIDSRKVEPSEIGKLIEMALKAKRSDDAFRHLVLRYLVSRCQDKEAEALIQQAAEEYRSIMERTMQWAQRYQVDRPLAIVDIREEQEPIDLTLLLLEGQKLAPIAIVRSRNLKTGEPQLTIAAATDSGYDFVKLFDLKGGMPTRVTLPEERYFEAIAKLKGCSPPDDFEPPAFLLYADLDRIKDYLFASVKLRHIVAASALLRHINEEQTKWLVCAYGGKVVFSAGGITEAVFKDEDKARQAAEELRKLYLEQTGSATVTVTVIPWREGVNFVQVVENAMREMSRRKAGEPERGREEQGQGLKEPEQGEVETTGRIKRWEEGAVMPFFSGSPFFRICEMTGRDFAVDYRQERDGTYRNIGITVLKAVEWAEKPHYQSVRLPLGKEVTPNLKLKDRLPVDTILRHLIAEERNKSPEEFSFPEDFEELVVGAQPRGYMGYIEADGNRFGELLKALKDGIKNKSNKEQLQAYQKFSDLLKETTQEALIDALMEVLKGQELAQQGDKTILPFRVLLLGGDDILLVIQAQYALTFAEAFCRLFQEKARRKFSQEPSLQGVEFPDFTMSAGVVIAHHNLPFLSLHRMASELLKSAKRRSWKAKQEGQEIGAVDFQVVTGSNIEDLKTLRREVYTVRDGTQELLMTGRPYLVSPNEGENELRQLLEVVESLKGRVARSRLKELGDIMRQGRQRGNFAFSRWFLRLDNEEAQKAIRYALGTKEIVPSLWQDDQRIGGQGKRFCRYLWDAVELLDFPQQRGRE
ncbi:Cas10/Cmr2 second palm domain-containing protein [Fervidibacter sacchari]